MKKKTVFWTKLYHSKILNMTIMPTSDSSYMIHSKYFALKRNLKQNENHYEFLVNFSSSNDVTDKFLKKVIKTLKRKWICEKHFVFIYISDKYNHDWTNQANNNTVLSASDNGTVTNNEHDGHRSYPMFDFTRDVKNVSIESQEHWDSVSSKCFLTSSSIFDWDFYELPWILQKFESGLGIFDRDSFFVTPTYMKDVLNTPIHYDLVLYYIKKYINIYGKSEFHDKYYGLYLLSKDSVGKAVLKFWYLETTDPSNLERVKLIKRIHNIYHNDTPMNHRFRLHLFYQSTCVPSVKQKFQINKYILSYLSFFGMYVDAFFLKDRCLEIERGLSHQKNIYLQQFSSSSGIVSQIQPLYDFFKTDNLIWISRKHVKRVKTPLFQFLNQNWDNNMRRNISLWDYRSINYSDTQYSCGSSLVSLFPKVWNDNFHRKDYEFVEPVVCGIVRRKKKL